MNTKYLNYKTGFWAVIIIAIISGLLLGDSYNQLLMQVEPHNACRILSFDGDQYARCLEASEGYMRGT